MELHDALQRAVYFASLAAQAVLPMRGNLVANYYKGGNKDQLVTTADLAVCELAKEVFGEADLVSEETYRGEFGAAVAKMRRDDAFTYVVDEIDGTADFASGLTTWGHLVGIVRGGRVVGSVMILPAYFPDFALAVGEPFAVGQQRGIMFVGAHGKLVSVAPTSAGRPGLLSPYRLPERKSAFVSLSAVETDVATFDYRLGLLPRSQCSCIADVAELLLGRTAVASFGSKLWDVAGMWAILDTLGFQWRRVGDLASPPEDFTELFNAKFSAKDSWWIGRDEAAIATANAGLRKR